MLTLFLLNLNENSYSIKDFVLKLYIFYCVKTKVKYVLTSKF